MILFDLQCDKQHRFEGWFDGNAGFESQVCAGLVVCPFCDSHKVIKAPMAPNIVSSRSHSIEIAPQKQENVSLVRTDHEQALYEAIKHVQEVIEKNCTDVGTKFADEARKIHYGETEKKNIRGVTTAKEAQELREEGVEFFSVPKFHKLNG